MCFLCFSFQFFLNSAGQSEQKVTDNMFTQTTCSHCELSCSVTTAVSWWPLTAPLQQLGISDSFTVAVREEGGTKNFSVVFLTKVKNISLAYCNQCKKSVKWSYSVDVIKCPVVYYSAVSIWYLVHTPPVSCLGFCWDPDWLFEQHCFHNSSPFCF